MTCFEEKERQKAILCTFAVTRLEAKITNFINLILAVCFGTIDGLIFYILKCQPLPPDRAGLKRERRRISLSFRNQREMMDPRDP